MDFKKNWIWILLGVILLIILIIYLTKSSTPSTPVVIQSPTTASTNVPSNNIAQIIAALAGLSTAVGGWGIFGSGSSSSGSSSGGQSTGGTDTGGFGGDVTTNPNIVV